MLDVAETIVSSAPAPRGVARRAPAHRLPGARRPAVPRALAGLPQRRRLVPGRVPAGHDHPLAAGERVYGEVAPHGTTASRCRWRATVRSRSPSPRFQDYEVPCPQGLGGPRRAQLHQGPARRHAVVPLVVPHGRLRQLRHDGQRRAEADLRHLPDRLRAGPVRVEPLRNFPVVRDLVVEIGDFMRKLVAVKPWIVREEEKPLSRGRVPADAGASWTSTSSSACASTACCATPPARSTAWTRSSSARPRSRWRSATTSTRRDEGAGERMEVLSEHEGIWGCTFVGECTKVCPKHVDPAGAIQRYKLTAALDVAQVVLHAARGAPMRPTTPASTPSTIRAGSGRACPPTGGCSGGRTSRSSCAS